MGVSRPGPHEQINPKCVLRDGAGAVLARGVLMRERLRYENNGLPHSHAMQVIVRPTLKPEVGHQ